MLEGALVVSQEEGQGEGEPLEVPCQVARVGHTLMGRPFQQMKEGHQAEVLEALRQEGPQFLEVQCCRPLLRVWQVFEIVLQLSRPLAFCEQPPFPS